MEERSLEEQECRMWNIERRRKGIHNGKTIRTASRRAAENAVKSKSGEGTIIMEAVFGNAEVVTPLA